MDTVDLKAQKRDTGKQISKRLRKSGLIPGVYYAKGQTGFAIAVKPISLRDIVYTSDTKMINLEIEGEPKALPCVMKEVKFDPITDKLIHFDLIGIIADKKMHFEVPIVLKGTAVGAKEGGIIQQILHKITIECLPIDMPNHIDLNITELKLGKSLHVSDILMPGVHILSIPETVVVTCVMPRVSTEVKADGAAAPDKAK